MIQAALSVPRPAVVIPVFEDGPGLFCLSEALLSGTLRPSALVLLDSSRMDTVWRDVIPEVEKAARDAGVRPVLRRLEPGRFNHGWTRNLGIALAGNPYVALFSQDAMPEPGCLESLVRRIIADDSLAGVYARQMPFSETSLPVRRRIVAHYPEKPESTPLSGNGIVRFDNVAAVIRTRAWDECPFPRVEIAEDIEWARTLSGRGWKFAYEPAARVRHAHELSAAADFDRNRKLHRLLARRYGVRTVPTLRSAVRETLGLVWRREHTPVQAAGEVFGQYLGGVVGTLERNRGGT